MIWNEVVKRWFPLVQEMERLGFEDYAVPELYHAAESTIADLLEACESTLELLDHMTTDQYSKGHDKQARSILAQAIESAK